MLYGYRVTDVSFDVGSRRPDRTLQAVIYSAEYHRRPVAMSLGVHLEGAVPFHPDMSCSITMLAAAVHRFGCEALPPVPRALQGVRACVEDALAQLPPLPYDADLSVETWLAKSQYTQKEKEGLLRVWRGFCSGEEWVRLAAECGGFVKDEVYDELKHARIINARSDLFKVLFGPVCKAIEEVLFSRPEFAKHVAWSEFPRVLRDELENPSGTWWIVGLVEGDDAVFFHNGRWYFTDYTSYESCFSLKLLRAVEIPMFAHFMRLLPDFGYRMRLMRRVLWSTNRTRLKGLRISVDGKRMSGDMHTSLGNGWANVMALKALTAAHPDRELTEADFAEIGLRCKMVTHSGPGLGSFCGQVFEEDELQRIRDPTPVLIKLGWSKRNHVGFGPVKRKALLKAKGMSLAHEMPSCPVLWRLAAYLVRETKDADLRKVWKHFSLYERDWLRGILGKPLPLSPPGIRTRILFAETYGWSVARQLEAETYLDNLVGIQPLDAACLAQDVSDRHREFAELYTSRHCGHRADWPAVKRPDAVAHLGQNLSIRPGGYFGT